MYSSLRTSASSSGNGPEVLEGPEEVAIKVQFVETVVGMCVEDLLGKRLTGARVPSLMGNVLLCCAGKFLHWSSFVAADWPVMHDNR